MLKKFLVLSMMGVFAFLLNSCAKESDTTTTEDFVNDTVLTVNRDGKGGEAGCYEFVYPISVLMPDSTVITADSSDSLKAAIRAWRVANPDVTGRPELVFPVSLLDEAGVIVTVASKEELKALIKECRGTFGGNGPGGGHPGGGNGGGHGGHGGHGTEPCFTINFPVTIAFPDSTTLEVADNAALKDAIKAWRQANPNAADKPSVVFPITVTLKDGTTQTVNSQSELHDLKKACRG